VQATVTTAQPVTQFMLEYDEVGHLLGKYANAGNVSDATETVWLGDLPVAILKPSNTYFVHADYLNTPRQVDNASKSAVWAWEPIAFGANAPSSDPNTTGTSFGYDLRFPGQVVDTEPGLRYSYFRDYDGQLGRYVESDPIGLAGGSYSTYAYVHGNPVSRTDPLGLCDQTPNCNTFLPNGQTIGQVVQNSVATIQLIGSLDPYGAAELAAFAATAAPHGPIDFKNNYGPDPTGFLGAAGNFAYGAIASGIGYPQSVAEAGAGLYAAYAGKTNPNNPYGEDNSAAQNLPAGYATLGCTQ
jgi:RHS repeat-associated protein